MSKQKKDEVIRPANVVPPLDATPGSAALNTRKDTDTVLRMPTRRWYHKLKKEGLVPEGKSLEGFSKWMRDSFEYRELVKEWEGFYGQLIQKGHGRGLAVGGVTAPGTTAVEPGLSRIPIYSSTGWKYIRNMGRGLYDERSVNQLREADIPTNQLEAFRNYLMGGKQTFDDFSTEQHARFLHTYENIDAIIAESYNDSLSRALDKNLTINDQEIERRLIHGTTREGESFGLGDVKISHDPNVVEPWLKSSAHKIDPNSILWQAPKETFGEKFIPTKSMTEVEIRARANELHLAYSKKGSIFDVLDPEGRSILSDYEKAVTEVRDFLLTDEGTNFNSRTGNNPLLQPRTLDRVLSRTEQVANLLNPQGKTGASINTATKALRTTDRAAQFGAALAVGTNTDKVIAGTQFTVAQAIADPKVQAQLSKQLTKLVGKYGAGRVAKLLPGIDILLSQIEAGNYMAEGRWDQATRAMVSGAIGWIPLLGDGASAILDAQNTYDDIERLIRMHHDPNYDWEAEFERNPQLTSPKEAAAAMSERKLGFGPSGFEWQDPEITPEDRLEALNTDTPIPASILKEMDLQRQHETFFKPKPEENLQSRLQSNNNFLNTLVA